MDKFALAELVAEITGEKKSYKNYQNYIGDQIRAILKQVDKYRQIYSYDISADPDSKNAVLEYMIKVRKSIQNKIIKSQIFISEKKLRIAYNLNDFHWFCIFLGIIKKLEDKKIWKGIAKIIDNFDEYLTYDTVFKLYYFVKDTCEIENFDNKVKNLQSALSKLGYNKNNAEIPDRLFKIITLNLEDEPSPNCLTTYYYTNKTQGTPLFIREEKAQKISSTILRIKTSDTLFYHMQGPEGIGKKTLIKRASKLLGRKLMIIDIQAAINDYGDEWFNELSEIIHENQNPKAILCFDKFHTILEQKTEIVESVFTVSAFKVLQLAQLYFKLVFVLSDEKIDELPFKRNFMWLSDNIPELSDDENLKLWQKHMSEIKEMTEETPKDIDNKFKFTPAQIKGAVHDAKLEYAKGDGLKLDKKQFARCVYNQSMSKLGDMARLITEPYTWDDIVLDKKTKEQIKDGCKRIKYQRKIRDDWKVKIRKGLSMLFYGSSGVGKTMAAQIFANDINMDIYQVDSSKIISKYIGETDKNLKAIFDEARKSNVVLLFDEADAIFAKRTEIKDSHDKNANTTASFLLQMLDTYPGIMILTTNFKGNIDEAFERRFTIKVQFGEFVTTKNRTDQVEKLKLKQDLFVAYFEKTKLPLNKNIDWSFLITQFNITGGEMRNIAETAAYEAADESTQTLEMKHILKAIQKELPPTDDWNGMLSVLSEFCDTHKKEIAC